MNRPLSECILVAFLDPATPMEIPVREIMERLPNHELEELFTDEKPIQLHYGPVYQLSPKKADEISLRIGFNSMSINAVGSVYRGWAEFFEKSIEILCLMEDVYKVGDCYAPIALQYVDVFEIEDGKRLEALSGIFHTSMKARNFLLQFQHEETLEETKTLLTSSYEFDSESRPQKIASIFTVQAVLPRIGKDRARVERWLQSSHILNKKLFWDALGELTRDGMGQLFSESESRLFSDWELGNPRPDLSMAYD